MFPKKYVPDRLSKSNKEAQIHALKKSKKDYSQGKYTIRPKMKSYDSKVSKHVIKAMKVYELKSIKPSPALVKKTGCKLSALKQIEKKGMGAYYSGGSRPSQTPHSWGRARLASALTGGKSAAVDFKILKKGCKPQSKALKLAKRAVEKHNKGQRRVPKISLKK